MSLRLTSPIVSGSFSNNLNAQWGYYSGTTVRHFGIDINPTDSTGYDVRPIRNGQIVYSSVSEQHSEFGYYSLIRHADDFGNLTDEYSFYAHFAGIPNFSKGDWVTTANVIGTVGSTGRSAGDHLHLSIYNNLPASLLLDGAITDRSTGITQSSYSAQTGFFERADEITGDLGLVFRNGNFLNDLIYGFSGDDSLYGGSGNDTLIGGVDNDFLDGGLGYDLAVVNSSFDASSITRFGNIVLVSGPDGNDSLKDVEAIQFSNMNVLVSSLPEAINIVSGQSINDTYVSGIGNALITNGHANSTLTIAPAAVGWSFFPGVGSVVERIRSWLVNTAEASEGLPARAILNTGTAQLAIDTRYERITIEGVGSATMQEILSPVLADDHGNSHTTATGLGSGNFISTQGRIESRSDTDWFAVTLQAGRTYAFMLSASADTALDPFLSLRLPNGTLLTNDDLTATNLTSFISYTATDAGTYHLQARGVGSTTGDYTLLASRLDVAVPGAVPTVENAPTDPNVNNSFWHWQGTSGYDDFGSSPQSIIVMGLDPNSGLRLRGHGGSDDIGGGRGNDLIWGDSGNDELHGFRGDDTIRGGTHSDTIYGGDGDDLLFGESGNDVIHGGEGFDTIFGGDGNDTIYAGGYELFGDNYVKGEGGNDLIYGGWDNDTLFGDEGDDTIYGGEYDDVIFGGIGNDSLYGDEDEDWIAGEAGHDRIFGGTGDDSLYGGDGNDTLMGGAGNDILHGERGIDTADFSDGTAGVTVNLFDEIAISTDLGQDRLYEIENVIGSAGNDLIDGDHGPNMLWGADGADRIRGHNGNDTLYGGIGDDTLWGDEGADVIYGDEGDDELRGGLGNDTRFGGSGDDHIRGEQGNDLIYGGDGIDTVFFWGEREDFSFFLNGAGSLVVTDARPDGLEGQDTLSGIEFLQFFDGKVGVQDLFAPVPLLVDDIADTVADTPIIIDVLSNDSFGDLFGTLLSVNVVAGLGDAYISDGRVIFDPRDHHDDLQGTQSREVEISYEAQSSALVRRSGVITVTVGASSGTSVPVTPTLEVDNFMIRAVMQETGLLVGGHIGLSNPSASESSGPFLLRIMQAGGPLSDLSTHDGAVVLEEAVDPLSPNSGQGRGFWLDAFAGEFSGEYTFYAILQRGTPGESDLSWEYSEPLTVSIDHSGQVGSYVAWAGQGDSYLLGGPMGDSLFGAQGNDTLVAGEGNDFLHGGAGNDEIIAGVGADYIIGGAGNDSITLFGTAYHTAQYVAYNVSSATQTGTGQRINLDGKVKIEAVIDGESDINTIYLGDEGDAFFLHDAYSGFHQLLALAPDYIGNDSMQRFINIQRIFGMDGDDIIDLTSPDYSLAGASIMIDGGEGNDVIWGSDADETIYGGAGDDTIFGGTGTDLVFGGIGADVFEFTKTSANTTVADFNPDEGDLLRFYNGGGAQFDPTSIGLTDDGIRIAYSEAGNRHEIEVALAVSAADFDLSLQQILSATEFF